MLARVLALAVLASAANAQLQQISVGGSFPTLSGGIIDVPQFDPALGELRSVYVRVSTSPHMTMRAENVTDHALVSGGFQCIGEFYPYAGLSGGGFCGGLYSPGSGDWQQCIGDLAAFDGTLDYAGPSSAVMELNIPNTWISNDGSETSGGPYYYPPGNNSLGVLANATGTGFASISVGGYASASILFDPNVINYTTTVTGGISAYVTYYYEEYPARFCQPGYQGCPCQGSSVNGCPNSVDANGADLIPSGHSRVLADDFALTASGMPASTTALFFQGTTAPYTGSPLADGVRCVGGQLVRLGVKHATAGAATFPGPGDPSISVKGNVSVGELRAYQAWYRDPAPGFCTSATSNLTSAVATVWTP